MYETLLFLHVLAAFALVAAVVIYSAAVLGASPARSVVTVANILWNVGGGLVLVFGVWHVLDLSAYELWDGWIIAALVLYAIATELGRRARASVTVGEDGTAVLGSATARLHWLRAAVTLAILVLMIYKPGA